MTVPCILGLGSSSPSSLSFPLLRIPHTQYPTFHFYFTYTLLSPLCWDSVPSSSPFLASGPLQVFQDKHTNLKMGTWGPHRRDDRPFVSLKTLSFWVSCPHHGAEETEKRTADTLQRHISSDLLSPTRPYLLTAHSVMNPITGQCIDPIAF